MSNAMVAIGEIERLATVMVKSRLFGVETVEQAMSLMMIADAEGRHPALAARDYHVIKGRPALKADAMLARFQQAGGVVSWTKYTEAEVTGEFSHPQSSPTPIAITWTFEQAKKIGLTGKDNWRNYPRAMLRARVISEGVRTVYPGISVGVYTVEEVQDFPEKDVTPSRATPTAGARERVVPDRIAVVDEVALKVLEWLNNGSVADAVVELDNHGLDADESVYLWSQFDSKQRAAMKKEESRQKAERKALAAPAEQDVTQAIPDASPVISPAQHKRLEARIKELGADRDKLKEWVLEKFGIDHLDKLTKDAYKAVDAMLDAKERKAAAPDADPMLQRIAACTALDALEVIADAFTDAEAVKYLKAYTAKKGEFLDAAEGSQV